MAIASSNGEYIDIPLGCAEKFYIYEVGEKIIFSETREVKNKNNHETIINLIQDCEVLIASKIGCNLVDMLFFSEIYPMVINGEIQKTLKELQPKIHSFRLWEKNQT